MKMHSKSARVLSVVLAVFTITAFFSLLTVNPVRADEPVKSDTEYIDMCTAYPAYGKVTASTESQLKTLPCAEEQNNGSKYADTVKNGDELTVCGLYLNDSGDYWYKVSRNNTESKNYLTDVYLYAGDTDFESFRPLEEKGTVSGQKLPTSVKKGRGFSLNGKITNKYTVISLVGARIETMSGEFKTGGEESSDSYSASLAGKVDSNTIFNILSVGTYVLKIYEKQYGYYAVGANEKAKYETPETVLVNATFTVSDEPVTTYTLSFDNNGHGNEKYSAAVVPGTTVILPELKDTDGFSFVGWSDTKEASASVYSAGTSYTVTADTEFYAVWSEVNTLRIYNSLGTVAVEVDRPDPFDYTLSVYEKTEGSYFSGWVKKPESTIYEYRPGDKIHVDGVVSLYPVYISHTKAISGNPVLIYDMNDVDTTGYDVSDTYISVVRKVVKNVWGDWSGWSTDEVSASDTRRVETMTIYRYYYYDCPECELREPYPGTCGNGHQTDSDADLYTLWSTIPYTQSNYSEYDDSKLKTSSLSDGLVWYFDNSDIDKTESGSQNSNGDTIIIKNYRYSELISTESIETAEYPAYILSRVIDYIISYDANGGTGSPSEEKYSSSSGAPTVTLSSVKPVRDGYTFLGWSESSDSNKPEYTSGASYSLKQSVTLYAVWSCDHTHTEIRNFKSPSVTAEGYTGDTYCTDCGKMIASGKATPKLSGILSVGVEDIDVQSGEEFTVTFDIENIDGIHSFSIWFSYDSDIFEFVSGSCLIPNYTIFDANEKDGLVAAFDKEIQTGNVASVTFRVKDYSLSGDYVIKYECVAEDSEYKKQSVSFDGKVNVEGCIRGDVDGNGSLNSADAIYLLRNIMRPTKYPIVQSVDMNGDGDSNSADALYLLRHIMRPDKYPLAK